MDRSNTLSGLGPRQDPNSRIQKPESAADKMAAIKARVAAAIGSSRAKGGLNVGLHPALEDLGNWKPSDKQGDAKPATSTGSSRTTAAAAPPSSKKKPPTIHSSSAVEGRSNPYYDDSAGHASLGRQRHSRQLIFNQKGKYIQQANALRKQAALEALKKRIAEQTRRAGIDEDLVVTSFVDPPPEIEWFDEALIEGKSYSGALKIATEDSIITEFVQHPVPLEPPQENLIPAPKPMPLTPKEQAKLRRQRRGAALKEEQAKIRLGLQPAPPPKVSKRNLMRVLGDQMVAEATHTEARVSKEIQDRFNKHMETNESRKLSKAQQHEKLAANQEKDAAKGLHVMVFKVKSLANGQHRYKINVNAEQLALTGVCILSPALNLIIVEGGAWSLAKYRKLMLNRIDWTENSPSRADGKQGAVREWLLAEDEKGGLKDLSSNRVTILFEGQVKTRSFKRWGCRVVETDSEARDILSRVKMESFWTLAKSAS